MTVSLRTEAGILLQSALLDANETLIDLKVGVAFKKQLPCNESSDRDLNQLDKEKNSLLCIERNGKKENIDMIDVKAINSKELKKSKALSFEIVKKVMQHIDFVDAKEPNTLVSRSGSKFDARKLSHHTLSIDAEHYLRLNGKRLALENEKQQYWPIKASKLRSYTILELEEDSNNSDIVFITDEYDKMRSDGKIMAINAAAEKTLNSDQILKWVQKDAINYNGNYLIIKRNIKDINS